MDNVLCAVPGTTRALRPVSCQGQRKERYPLHAVIARNKLAAHACIEPKTANAPHEPKKRPEKTFPSVRFRMVAPSDLRTPLISDLDSRHKHFGDATINSSIVPAQTEAAGKRARSPVEASQSIHGVLANTLKLVHKI